MFRILFHCSFAVSNRLSQVTQNSPSLTKCLYLLRCKLTVLSFVNLITQIIKKCTGRSIGDLNDILKYILPMVLTDMEEDEIMELAMIAIPMLTDLKLESNQCPAEGTYWGEIVNLFGYDSGVIKCNVFANKQRLMAIAEEGKSVSELDTAE